MTRDERLAVADSVVGYDLRAGIRFCRAMRGEHAGQTRPAHPEQVSEPPLASGGSLLNTPCDLRGAALLVSHVDELTDESGDAVGLHDRVHECDKFGLACRRVGQAATLTAS